MNKLSTRQIFAQMLVKLRKDKGISRKKLAEDIGVSSASIGYYENADRAPDIDILVKIADYFNVTCDEMLRGVKSPDKNIYKDLWLSDKALNSLRKLKALEPINPTTQTSYLFEFFDDLVSDFRFRIIMKYYYRFSIGYDGFVELNDACTNASAEALAIMDEFLGVDKSTKIRTSDFNDYYLFKILRTLEDIAADYNYKNLREYEYYMEEKIDDLSNSAKEEKSENGKHNPSEE